MKKKEIKIESKERKERNVLKSDQKKTETFNLYLDPGRLHVVGSSERVNLSLGEFSEWRHEGVRFFFGVVLRQHLTHPLPILHSGPE